MTSKTPGRHCSWRGRMTIMSKFEYADDAALVDADAATATAKVTALAAGSLTGAAMMISQAKSKVMHIHRSSTEPGVRCQHSARECLLVRVSGGENAV